MTDVMRYLTIPIERTFKENDQDRLAQFVIGRMKQYESAEDRFGFSIIYCWQSNTDGIRSLWCRVDADPKDLMAAYDTSILLEKQ